MVHSTIFTQIPYRRRRVCTSWADCCLLIVPQLISGDSASTTIEDSSPLTLPATSRSAQRRSLAPVQVRICRLMHRQLPPGGRIKLDVQRRRNHRRFLVDKKKQRIFGSRPTSGAHRATLPNFFPKRLKRRISEKCAIPVVREKDREPTPELNDYADSAQGTPSQSVAAKPAVDTLKKSYKEYCAIQWTIRLWFSMLQERLEELEQGTDTTKEDGNHPTPESGETSNELNDESGAMTTSSRPIKKETSESNRADSPAAVQATKRDGSDPTPIKQHEVPSECASNKAGSSPSALPDTGPDPKATDVVRDRSAPSTPNKQDNASRPSYSLLETSKTDVLDPTYTCDIELEPLENRKSSFVDSLLNKFNLSPPVKQSPQSYGLLSSSFDGGDGEGSGPSRRSLRDRRKIAARPRYIEIPEEPRKVRVSKVFGQLHKSLNIDLECTNSNSSTEFYGFDEGEVVKLDKPKLPGLLPTPIVRKSQPYAPFLSYGSTIGATTEDDDDDDDDDDGSAGRDARSSDLFREQGRMSFGSLPPRLECPQRPGDMVRPRTVAQKRILLQKENDVRYPMIDNESKIFHFITKRAKNIEAGPDAQRMKELQNQPIPFTRGTWRALSWLRTEKDRYYYQTVNIDRRLVKLYGGQGNHQFRKLTRKPIFSGPVVASGGCRVHYITNCRCPEHPENVTLDIPSTKPSSGLQLESEHSGRPRLLPVMAFPPVGDYRTHRSYPHTKPGPLSSKCVRRDMLEDDDDDPYLGPHEIFHMPPVELEVFPKINRPIDGYVKPYLKLILPHRGITENWARFAVSTLRPPVAVDAADGSSAAGTKQPSIDEEPSFVFQLPYANNQRRMLIRRRLIVRPGTTVPAVDMDLDRFEQLMDEKLTFREALRSNGEVDADELVCADVLSEMTDAVAIALAEDVFQQDDPDGDYSRVDPPVLKVKPPTNAEANARTTCSPAARPVADAASEDSLASPAAPGDAPSSKLPAATNLVPAVPPECSKQTDPAKLKLLREMKRLNATIIESRPGQPKGQRTSTTGGHSAVAAADSLRPSRQRCDPQYCGLGCICDVLLGDGAVADALRKQRCRKVDCIFGCKCGFEQKRAVGYAQQVADGSGSEVNQNEAKPLFSADMKHLHEEVTERLAKEERQFTSTVIVTDEAAVVVRNSESETRRQKKMPKKYDDYYNEKSVQSLLNGGAAVPPVMSFVASEPPPNMKPLSAAERMRHAHVILNRLPELNNLEPWCMVHELYRCFCGGKATQGKPFSFTEENCISMQSKQSAGGASSSASGSTTSISSSSSSSMAAKPTVNGVTATVAATAVTDGRMMRTVPPSASASGSGKMANNKQQMLQNAVTVLAPAGTHTPLYDTRRKRLYSFEKAPEQEQQQQPEHTKTSKASSSFGAPRRRDRDSSEESYRPPYEKKPSKAKKVKFSDHGRRASVAVRSDLLVVARKALPPRRASIAAREKVSFYGLHEDEDTFVPPPPPPPPPTVTTPSPLSRPTIKVIRRSDPSPGGSGRHAEPQYTVVSQSTKNATGKSGGISNIIIKRIPALPPPSPKPVAPSVPVGRKSAPSSTSAIKKSTVGRKASPLAPKEPAPAAKVEVCAKIAAPGTAPIRMTVSELRKLFQEEHASGEKAAAATASGLPSHSKKRLEPQIRFVDLVDTEENIDNAQYLNNLTDGTKKLVICGNKRTFVQNADIQDGRPPEFMVPFTDRITYIVQIPQQQTKLGETPAAGATSDSSSAYQKLVSQTDGCLVSLMRHINDLLGRDRLNIQPSKRGIMYICRWKLFLRAFVLSQVDVLDVALKNGLELTVVTGDVDQSWQMPPDTVQTVTSARRTTLASCCPKRHDRDTRRLSMLLRMLIQRVDNVKTDQLALVLYGSRNFWHFCGFLKTGPGRPYVNNSNILSEPSTQANAMVLARLREYYSKTMRARQDAMAASTQATPVTQTPTTTPTPLPVSKKATPIPGSNAPGPSSKEGGDAKKPPVASNLDIIGISPCTSGNIADLLKQLTQAATNRLNPSSVAPGRLPAPNSSRWMRLTIARDFSDMFIPSLGCNTSYVRIVNAITSANKQMKAVRLQLPGIPSDGYDCGRPNAIVRLYSLPGQKSSIFIGPFQLTQVKLDVILCQMVDGKMYTREEFQRLNAIQAQEKPRTVGCWIDTPAQAPPVPDVRCKARLSTAPPISSQRSLLKRNLINNSSQQPKQKQMYKKGPTAAEQQVGAQGNDDDCVVVLDEESNMNDKGVARTTTDLTSSAERTTGGSSSSTMDTPKQDDAAGPLGDGDTGGEPEHQHLLRLLEKTIAETKEDKRKLANMVASGSTTTRLAPSVAVAAKMLSKNSVTVVVKRQSTDSEQDGSGPAPKLVRRSVPLTVEAVRRPSTASTNGSSTSTASLGTQALSRRLSGTRMSLPNRSFLSTATSIAQKFKIPQTTTIVKTVTSSAKLNGLPSTAVKPPDAKEVVAKTKGSVLTTSTTVRPKNGITSTATTGTGNEQVTIKPLSKLVSPVEEDVVCLDDDDDGDEDDRAREEENCRTEVTPVGNGTRCDRGKIAPATPAPRAAPAVASLGQPVPKDRLNISGEQMALLASKWVNLEKSGGQQKLGRFNAETGILTVKRSLIDSLTRDHPNILKQCSNAKPTPGGSSTPSPPAAAVTIKAIPPKTPTTSTTAAAVTPVATATSTPTPATETATTSTSSTTTSTTATTKTVARKITLPRTKVVPRMLATPAAASVTSGDGSTNGDNLLGDGSCGSSEDLGRLKVKCLSPAMEAARLTKPHRLGVLESKIDQLGLVEIVRLEDEVIIRVKELTGRGQHVALPNLEQAVALLNTFIQRNTYTFVPYDLAIQWEFKERTTPLAASEDLTKIINQRCIVTRYGLIETSKTEPMRDLEQSLPMGLYEEVMLAYLAIQCVSKDVYETKRCYECVTKVRDPAVNMIARLKRSDQMLTARKKALAETVQNNRAKMKRLSRAQQAAANRSNNDEAVSQNHGSASDGNRSSVIVIDDD